MERPKLRIRTVLVLIGVAALACGALASLRSRAIERQEALAAVDRLHGTYGIRVTGPEWYRTMMGWLGADERAFYDPLRISLGPFAKGYDPGRPIRDEDLEALSPRLARFTSLEILDLMGCRDVTDRGIDSLPGPPNLKAIRLGGTAVTGRGIEGLRGRYPKIQVKR